MVQQKVRQGRFSQTAMSDRAHANLVQDAVKILNGRLEAAGLDAELLVTLEVRSPSKGPLRWPMVVASISRPLVRDGLAEPVDQTEKL